MIQGVEEAAQLLKSNATEWNAILLKRKTVDAFLRLTSGRINRLELRIELADYRDPGTLVDKCLVEEQLKKPELPRNKKYWSVRVVVDNRDLRTHVLDLQALVASTHRNDEHYIFTCDCGVPKCAGIERGVTVVSDGGITVWKGYGLRPRRVFLFNTQQYREEVLRVARDFVRCFKSQSADQVEHCDEYIAGLSIYVDDVGRLEKALYEATPAETTKQSKECEP